MNYFRALSIVHWRTIPDIFESYLMYFSPEESGNYFTALSILGWVTIPDFLKSHDVNIVQLCR